MFKIIKTIAYSTLISLALAACSGGGSDSGGVILPGALSSPLANANLPEGTKNIFTIESIGAATLQRPLETGVTTAASRSDELIAKVLYATTKDNSIKEILFTRENGNKARLYISEVENINGGFLSARVTAEQEVAQEQIDSAGNIVRIFGMFTYANKQILINKNSGKIYDLTASVKQAAPNQYEWSLEYIEKVGNWIYTYSRELFSLDLTNNKIYRKTDAQYDDLGYYSSMKKVFFGNGEMLLYNPAPYDDKTRMMRLFPGGANDSVPYNLDTDKNIYKYLTLQMPVEIESKLDNYRMFYRHEGQTYWSPTLLTGESNIIVSPVRYSGIPGILFYRSSFLDPNSAILPTGTLTNNGFLFKDNEGNAYIIRKEQMFDTPLADPQEDQYGYQDIQAYLGTYAEHDKIVCEEVRVNNSDKYKNCYKKTDYVVLRKVFIENKTLKTEIVAKQLMTDGSPLETYIWNTPYRYDVYFASSDKYLPVQRVFDEKAFYTIDLATKTITKTPWNLDINLFKDAYVQQSDIKQIGIYGTAGFVWENKNRDALYYQSFEENASTIKFLEANIAGRVKMSGDLIYYTERVSGTEFATFSYNLKTNEKTKISSSQLSFGNIIELAIN